MTPSHYFRRSALAFAGLVPTAVFAHPGHDGDHGGGLTWDFVGEVLHRLTSPYHLLPLAATAGLVMAVVYFWRRGRNDRGIKSREDRTAARTEK